MDGRYVPHAIVDASRVLHVYFRKRQTQSVQICTCHLGWAYAQAIAIGGVDTILETHRPQRAGMQRPAKIRLASAVTAIVSEKGARCASLYARCAMCN